MYGTQLLDAFAEGLESSNVEDRQGSCEALAVLQAKSAVEQLAFIGQSDPSPEVRYVAHHRLA